MTVPTTSWDETAPAGSTAISAGDNRIREMKTQIREVIDVDHDFPSSGQDAGNGQHKQVTLQEQANLGTGAVNATILGSQTVGGKGELMYTDEDDNDIQVTSGGSLGAATTAFLCAAFTAAGAMISNLATTAANLVLNNTGNGPHMRMTGDPTVASPTDGDLWYTGSSLNVRNGSETIDLIGAAFSAKAGGAQTDIATGSAVTVTFSEVFDDGGNFASNTFTAPTTGRYLLSLNLVLGNLDISSSGYTINIVTSARTYTSKLDVDQYAGDVTFITVPLTVVADMAASATAHITVNQTAGAAQTDIEAESYFTGSLIR
jgi:hypothetical protein